MPQPAQRRSLELAALWGLLIGAVPATVLAFTRWATAPAPGQWSIREVSPLDDVFYWVGVFAIGPILFVLYAAIMNALTRKF